MSVQVFFLLHSTTVQNFPFILNFNLFFFYPLYKVCAGPSGGSAEFNPSATTVELND